MLIEGSSEPVVWQVHVHVCVATSCNSGTRQYETGLVECNHDHFMTMHYFVGLYCVASLDVMSRGWHCCVVSSPSLWSSSGVLEDLRSSPGVLQGLRSSPGVVRALQSSPVVLQGLWRSPGVFEMLPTFWDFIHLKCFAHFDKFTNLWTVTLMLNVNLVFLLEIVRGR